jgi:hypothetical protein
MDGSGRATTAGFAPMLRALVAAALVLATLAVMLVTVSRPPASDGAGIRAGRGYNPLILQP